MLLRTFFLATLTVLLAAFPFRPVGADGAITGDDRIGLLYSSRLTFTDKGVPELGVGLMTGRDSMSFRAASAISVTVYTPGARRISLAATRPFSVRLGASKAAEATAQVVVATVRQSERPSLAAIRDSWLNRGVETRVIRVGSIIALKGEVINNVRYHVVTGSFTDLSAAERLVRDLTERFGANAHIFRQVTRPPTGTISLVGPDGEVLATSKDILLIETADRSPITVPNCDYGRDFSNHGPKTRAFRGLLYVAIDGDGKLALGNWISLEMLLEGTVPAEIFQSAPPEALKAQAVAARGQLLARLGTRHLADPFHLCASQHCQAYEGINAQSARTSRAVRETRGLFLVSKGELVNTVYSASCGGHTEDNETVWPQPPDPHLRGKPDGPPQPGLENGISEGGLDAFLDRPPRAYCRDSGYNEDKFRWTRVLSAKTATALVNRKHPVGELLDLVPGRLGVSGRLIELKVVGRRSTVTVRRELQIRRLLGNLPSALIRIRTVKNGQGKVERFEITGAGFGHGVGMCQTGAIGRALAGQGFERILRHYYGQVEFKRLY